MLAADQGAVDHAERRRDVELLVQPADGAALSRHRRQRVSVSRLQRPAGERVGLHRQPRQRRRDLRSRLAAGRRRRVRLRRARSARPRHRLRRQNRDALRSPDRADLRRRSGRRSRRRRGRSGELPSGPDDAGRVLGGGPAVAVLRQQRALEDVDGGKNWKQISPDLTRTTYEVAEEHRQVPRPGDRTRHAARRHLHRRAVLQGHQSHLGRHRRRPDPHDGRRRRDWKDVTPPALTPWAKVSIIDAGRFDPLTAYAAVNTLRLDDLRPHIYRTHDGGQDLDGDRRRDSRRRDRQRRARGSEEEGPAVRRHRAARSMSRSTTADTGSRCG